MVNFFILLGGLFVILPIHSFFLYPISLLLIRHFHRQKDFVCSTPKAMPTTICMCAYNEEKVIDEKLDNLSGIQKRYNVDIHIYTDNCSDNTVEMIKKHSAKVHLIEGKKRAGKSLGMTTLLKECTSDIVVFTDANSMLNADKFPSIYNYFQDPTIGCVCGNLIYTNEDEGETAQVGSLYWRYEEFLKKLETETGSTQMADGALFAIRRKLFRDVPSDIIDDMHTSFGALLQGYRVVQSDDFVAYERSTTSEKEEFRRKIRITCRAFNCHRYLWGQIKRLPLFDFYKYISHKFIRWLTIYFMGCGCFFFSIALYGYNKLVFTAFIAAMALVLILGRNGFPCFSSLYNIIQAFLATGIGVLKSLKGERYQTWTPPKSTR